MLRLLSFFTLVLIISACSAKQNDSILFVHEEEVSLDESSRFQNFPPLLEIVTMGIINDKQDVMKEKRKKFLEKKYVTDENDDRNLIEKSSGFITLGLIGGRETKKQHAARLLEEDRLKNISVSDEHDTRGVIAHSFNALTLGTLAKKETKIEREERLKKEALKNENLDKRGVAMKSIEVFSFGSVAPGKPKPIYSKNAVLAHPKLGLLEYDISTYNDAVKILGKPLKLFVDTNNEKIVVFKVEEETFKFIPYIGTPQKDVRLHFDKNDVLIKQNGKN